MGPFLDRLSRIIRARRKSLVWQHVWVLVQLIFDLHWPMNQPDKNPNIAKTDFLRALRIMHAEFIFWGRAPEIDINRIACRPLSLFLSRIMH